MQAGLTQYLAFNQVKFDRLIGIFLAQQPHVLTHALDVALIDHDLRGTQHRLAPVVTGFNLQVPVQCGSLIALLIGRITQVVIGIRVFRTLLQQLLQVLLARLVLTGFQFQQRQRVQPPGILPIQFDDTGKLLPGRIQIFPVQQHAAVGKQQVGIFRSSLNRVFQHLCRLRIALQPDQHLCLEDGCRGQSGLQGQCLLNRNHCGIELPGQYGHPALRHPCMGIEREALGQPLCRLKRRLLIGVPRQHGRRGTKTFFRIVRDPQQVDQLFHDLVKVTCLQSQRCQGLA